MSRELAPADYRELAEQSRRRRIALIPDTPMNRYSIAAMQVFEETMERLADGSATFVAATDAMIRQQSALAIVYGVEP